MTFGTFWLLCVAAIKMFLAKRERERERQREGKSEMGEKWVGERGWYSEVG